MSARSVLFLLLPPAIGLISHSSCDKGSFSYVLSVSAVDPVYGVRLDSTVPAVELALDHVNTNPTLLPGVNLTYGDTGMLAVSCRVVVGGDGDGHAVRAPPSLGVASLSK